MKIGKEWEKKESEEINKVSAMVDEEKNMKEDKRKRLNSVLSVLTT